MYAIIPKISLFFLVLLFLSSCKDEVSSVAETGEIYGRVFDQDGKVVSGVLLTTTPATISLLTTDSTGLYSISGIESGTYVVKASKKGFEPGSTTVKVTVGKRSQADIVLGVINSIDTTDTNNTNSKGAGNCVQLDGMDGGSGSCIKVAHNQDLVIASESFTIEAWVNPSSILTHSQFGQWIVAKGNTNSDLEFELGLNRDRKLQFGSSKFGVVTTGISLSIGMWTHIAVSYNSLDKTVSVFVNGNLVATQLVVPTSAQSVASTLFIGAKNNNGTDVGVENWDGQIDEVRIWNKLRTQSEIFSNKNKKMSGNESGLVAYWRFDESDGLVANDKTGKSHTGVLVNNVKRVVSTAPISE